MKTIKLILVLLFVLMTTVGISVGSEKDPSLQVLNFALPGNPDTLDPHATSGTLTFQTVKSFYDTLVEPDKTGNLIPALAEKWESSQDNLVWTFYLKKGVTFHNGDAFTSADVKTTFEHILDKKTASPKAKEYAAVSSIETPGEYQVVFTLSEPFSPFLSNLASGWGAILPRSLIESNYNFGNHPVGTGPFVFKEWIRDNRIVLEKNGSYWKQGLPKLDRINLNIIPENAVQVQSLITGQIDIQYIVDGDDLATLKSAPGITIEKNLTSLILVLSMNCEKGILADLRVRQAINHAIDKQTVLDVAYGSGNPIGTFMDYSNAYYKDFVSLYPYDPGKAKALLKEAGVTRDQELTLFLPQNYPLHVKAGEIYQEMLSQVGLNVKIQLVDWSAWISDVYRGGKYDLTVIGHTGKLDPHGTLGGYGAGKYVNWHNEKTAGLINEAKTVSNIEKRKTLYGEALEIMAREVPFMYLGSSYRYTAYNEKIKGFLLTPQLDTFDFRWTEITEK